MTNRLSAELTAFRSVAPAVPADSRVYGGKMRRIRASFTLAAQASGDTLEIGTLPIGASFAGVRITAGASLGAAATIAIGIAGSTAKYKAAAIFTAVDTPTVFAKAGALDDAPLAAEEIIIATLAVAALPNTGEALVIEIFYTTAS